MTPLLTSDKAPMRAAMLAQDVAFRRYVARKLDLPEDWVNETGATVFLCKSCKIESRKELQSNPKAFARFQVFLTEFEAAVGRIASPRNGR